MVQVRRHILFLPQNTASPHDMCIKKQIRRKTDSPPLSGFIPLTLFLILTEAVQTLPHLIQLFFQEICLIFQRHPLFFRRYSSRLRIIRIFIRIHAAAAPSGDTRPIIKSSETAASSRTNTAIHTSRARESRAVTRSSAGSRPHSKRAGSISSWHILYLLLNCQSLFRFSFGLTCLISSSLAVNQLESFSFRISDKPSRCRAFRADEELFPNIWDTHSSPPVLRPYSVLCVRAPDPARRISRLRSDLVPAGRFRLFQAYESSSFPPRYAISHPQFP